MCYSEYTLGDSLTAKPLILDQSFLVRIQVSQQDYLRGNSNISSFRLSNLRQTRIFIAGEVYRRRDLHTQYGGQEQEGISTPSKHPFILIFTGSSGEQYGYKDGWQQDGTFLYTGEGQHGNMTFIRGNSAIRDHVANGKSLYLFENASSGHVRYVGEMVYRSHRIVPGEDVNGLVRDMIVFELDSKRV